MPRIVPSMPTPPRLEEVIAVWVDKYGESVNQARAAQILGCDRSTVCRLVKNGTLPSTPLKAILVRPMAEWAYRDYCNSRTGRKRCIV